jgi:hypothetical protein
MLISAVRDDGGAFKSIWAAKAAVGSAATLAFFSTKIVPLLPLCEQRHDKSAALEEQMRECRENDMN